MSRSDRAVACSMCFGTGVTPRNAVCGCGALDKSFYAAASAQARSIEEDHRLIAEAEGRVQGARGGAAHGKYRREIKPGVFVDVYDVLQAFDVRNPALQHLVKKALAPGQRGHKDRTTDLDEIVQSAIRAKELEA